VPVELLGELLGDHAATRILACLQRGHRRSPDTVNDFDQKVRLVGRS